MSGFWSSASLSTEVMAAPTIRLEAGLYQSGPVGSSRAPYSGGDIPGNPVGSTWQTFCVEKDEYVSLPSNYFAVVNTAAVLAVWADLSRIH